MNRLGNIGIFLFGVAMFADFIANRYENYKQRIQPGRPAGTYELDDDWNEE